MDTWTHRNTDTDMHTHGLMDTRTHIHRDTQTHALPSKYSWVKSPTSFVKDNIP
jgi:hypothetical protein